MMTEAPKRIVAGTHSVLGINFWRGPERRQDLLEGAVEYVRADLAHAELMRVREEMARLRARLKEMEGGDDG